MDAADREKTAFVTQGGLRIGERPRDVREVDGTSAERDRVVGVSSIPG